MSGELSGVGGNSPVQQNIVQQSADATTNPAISAKAKQAVQDVAAIISGLGVKVTTPVVRNDGAGTPTGPTNIPALDNPADIKQIEANLEKLIAYLQLDNEERQAEMAKERIDMQKDSLATEHKERGEKIKDSIKKMDEAAKSRLANRIFGWLGAILAVVSAVIAVGVAIASGGAGAVAAGFAVAGAIVAVTNLVLSETGAMDKMVESLAKALKESGMSKQDAQFWSSLIINGAFMAASVICGIGSMAASITQLSKAAVQTVSAVARAIQTASTISNSAVGVGGLAAGIANTVTGYNSQMADADVTELAKIIAELQRRLEESEEELQALLEALQNNIGQIAELLASETDTQSEIANQIGQMA